MDQGESINTNARRHERLTAQCADGWRDRGRERETEKREKR